MWKCTIKTALSSLKPLDWEISVVQSIVLHLAMEKRSLCQIAKAVALEYILSKESICLPWINETKILNPMELLSAQMALFMFVGVAVIVFVFLVQRVNFCFLSAPAYLFLTTHILIAPDTCVLLTMVSFTSLIRTRKFMLTTKMAILSGYLALFMNHGA